MLKTATFAGGCFWCTHAAYEELKGVTKVRSGYTSGQTKHPTYEEVSLGTTGHYEAVQVEYDPEKTRYEGLLDTFWRQIDPTDEGGQFADRGSQYRTAIFYHDKEQKKKAEASKEALASSGKFEKPIATAILPAKEFYEAQTGHQSYAKKHPLRYKAYAELSGRKPYLRRTWKRGETVPRAEDEELKRRLTPLQYEVARNNGTEPPFDNEYWDNKEEGIYVDIITGKPLFSSKDKYDSGTGWPSFTKPIAQDAIIKGEDRSHGMIRTEVKSKDGTHLGHVFDDGPREKGGLRYCLNSAALRFIPKEKLKEEGHGELKALFA